MESDSEPEVEGRGVQSHDSGSIEILKNGWLSKEGGVHKSIKKRWFVLTKAALKYYETEKQTGSLGVILVRRVTGVAKAADNAFQIETRERVFFLIAPSPEEQEAWVMALKAIIPADAKNLQPAVLKSGYLTKQGGTFKSWKKRWFVLTKDNVLTYYHEQGDVIPLREIDLEQARGINLIDSQKEIGFELFTWDRIYCIHAATKDEAESWVQVISPLIAAYGYTTPHLRIDDEEEITVTADEISTFIKADTKITKQGYLVKQGAKFKTWRKRWFILRESTLSYYEDQDHQDAPLGLILLKDCKSFDLASKKVNKPYAFEIATSVRTFFCYAGSEDEMWEWINVLTEAVTKASGKESLEFIALKKAAELAQKKKDLQLQIYRNATARSFRKRVSRFRNSQHKKVILPKAIEETNWTKEVVVAEEKKPMKNQSVPLEELEKLMQSRRSDLSESIQAMEKDIAELNSQLQKRRLPEDGSEEEEEEDDDDECIPRRRTPDEDKVFARAIMDYSPNAYDDEALGFQRGDIILIERKDASGNWAGQIVKKASPGVMPNDKIGNFPYRYVEELDTAPDLSVPKAEPPPPPPPAHQPGVEWNEELDGTATALFDMYDSDGDGFMTKLDFFEFLYEFGKTHLTDKQVDKCWETLDEKKTGKVDQGTFRIGIRKLEAADFHSSWTGEN